SRETEGLQTRQRESSLFRTDFITAMKLHDKYHLNPEDYYVLADPWRQEWEKGVQVPVSPHIIPQTVARAMEEFERCCYDRMRHAMADVVCDVCRSPDSEDNNEMVFCDKCNICVHQVCYGILKVPKGSWLCHTCALGISPKCQVCPKKGGAMKPTCSGTKWVHVSCALWIPEVTTLNPDP
uniref:Protein Jade-1 n=1 Tax=Hucho hucho TaxID=62062 RepID=A0A4W5MEJ5_9TELE